MSFANVNAIVDANAYKRPARKPPKPLKTSGGTLLPEDDIHRLPGEFSAAVVENGRRDDPLRGKRCAIRWCRDGAQYVVRQRLDEALEQELIPDPYVPSDNPLVIQLEAAVHAARPAVMVDTGEPTHLCLKHYHEFLDARNAKVVQEREKRQVPSWPLYELNYEGASVEVENSTWFTLTDGDGKRMRLEVRMHLDEVRARMAGKEYRTQVLTPEQRRQFVLALKFPNAADIPLAAQVATTHYAIQG